MLKGFRPSFEVVKEGRISRKFRRHLEDHVGVSFWLGPGSCQIFGLNPNKIV